MKTTIRLLLPLLISFLVGCGSPQSRSEGGAETHDTTETTVAAPLETDSSSLARFIDTLRLDLERGSLSFLLARRIEGIGFRNCVDSSTCPYLNDTGYATATARLLAWHLKYSGFELDTTLERKGFAQAPVYPRILERKNRSFGVFVVKPEAGIFSSIGTDSIREIGAKWVKKLDEKGGIDLPGYPGGKIQQDWLQVETPDGIKGWVRGESVRSLDGPYLSLSFFRRVDGWKVASILGMDDPEDAEPADP